MSVDACCWVQECPNCAAECRLERGELRCPVCRQRLDWGIE